MIDKIEESKLVKHMTKQPNNAGPSPKNNKIDMSELFWNPDVRLDFMDDEDMQIDQDPEMEALLSKPINGNIKIT